ncbi:MAG: winged helix DNA-binding domain-containing protein [Actinomycetota bacterium]|nr:winged helix DNA-binding domain-containing protein [Actinomycetota bacterium]
MLSKKVNATPGGITVARGQWLGFRWQRHGLDSQSREGVLDDLLLLGFQDSRHAGAEQSLIQRTSRIGSTSVTEVISPDGPLVSLWSVRGAPHAHRVAHLDFVRDALAPRPSDAGGTAYVEAVEEVAAALSAVVTGPTSKSKASREVADRVSGSLVEWCARCKADHVPDALFRAAGRHGQIVLGPEEQQATMLYPTPEHPQEKVDRPRLALLSAYFRVNGPTTRTLFRDWMESDTQAIAVLWRELGDDLVRVRVDNRRYDLPVGLVEAVKKAPKPDGVVLVPPHDPYLRQVDRTLLVPDSRRRHEVWRALSGPGALLVDGEVAGTWRYRRSDHEVTITPFDSLTSAQRTRAEKSADRIAKATGDDQPKVAWV